MESQKDESINITVFTYLSESVEEKIEFDSKDLVDINKNFERTNLNIVVFTVNIVNILVINSLVLVSLKLKVFYNFPIQIQLLSLPVTIIINGVVGEEGEDPGGPHGGAGLRGQHALGGLLGLRLPCQSVWESLGLHPNLDV